MASVNIKYQRIGRKHVFYSPDLPGFRVADTDKKMAYYRVSGELAEYLERRDKCEHVATSPGTFEDAFGSTSSECKPRFTFNRSSGPTERVAVATIGQAKTNKEAV